MAAQLPRPALRRAAAIGALGLGLLGTLAGCAAADTGTDSGSGGQSGDDGVDESADTSAAYADGSYEADGSYQSPGGTESITVNLTLSDDIVTAVEVVQQASAGNAAQFQGQFAAGIADVVVGQDIDSLNVTRVAGSSLTSGGFADALETIKSEALA